ncbi:MAG: sensor histidine kinase [Eubacterium sp.]|nr:sensor histidine kinase [Eubacterium sp.]
MKLGRLSVLYHNANLRTKILIGVYALTLTVVIVITLLADVLFSRAFQTSDTNSTLQSIRQANAAIDAYLINTENVMQVLTANRQIQNMLQRDGSAEETSGSPVFSTGNYLASLMEIFPYFTGIALVGKNNTLFSNEMQRNILVSLVNEDWYKTCEREPDTTHIRYKPIDRSISYNKPVSADGIISMTKAVRDPVTKEIIGVILIDLDASILNEALETTNAGKDGFLMVQDHDGAGIYMPANAVAYRIRTEWFEDSSDRTLAKRIDGTNYQIICTNSSYTGWNTIGVFSMDKTLEQVLHFRMIMIVLASVMVIFTGILGIRFSRSISTPLTELTELTSRVEQGDLSVQFSAESNDEIGKLGTGFNSMVNEIQRLVDTVLQNQRQMRESDLATLQEQIKPHFLYNTFDTIHWLARRHHAEDIAQLIAALTKLYRISLSRGSEIITLEDEIEHVRNYLYIQKVRYSDIMDYEISSIPEAPHLFVQKLILQPLVENAIYHGIKNRSSRGMVRIRTSIEEDVLILEVTDDGPGIPPERLQELQAYLNGESPGKTGYGLYNVNKRITLRWGDAYGVRISSPAEGGTSVRILYPVKYQIEGEDNV